MPNLFDMLRKCVVALLSVVLWNWSSLVHKSRYMQIFSLEISNTAPLRIIASLQSFYNLVPL